MDREHKQAFQLAVGERVIRLRACLDLTEKQLADELGLSSSSPLNQWETGYVMPSFENALLLYDLLGVSLDWLYDGDPSALQVGLHEQLYSAETEARMAEIFRRSPAKRRAHRPFRDGDPRSR